MTLKITRRIRDNLHGSIDLSELEDLILAEPIFQRLRRVKQTAFLGFVFPGATHTRFEHSLGVMHQAGLAWSKLKDNQIRIYDISQKYKNFAAYEQENQDNMIHGLLSPTFSHISKVFNSDYILQTLRLAALLHDVGHAPFSHSSERFMPNISKIIESNNLPDYIQSYLYLLIEKHGENVQAHHEIYTIILVDQILTKINVNTSLKLKIDPQDVVSMIIPEIDPSKNSELLTFDVHKLCHEIVSGEIDIDRMDYLRRDSRECGVVYGIFDIDRIVNSLSLYYNLEDKRLHLAIQFSGLAAFEDYLRARQSMYIQLYFHKTSVAGEAMLQHLANELKDWKLPANIDDYVDLDECNILQHLLQAGKEKFNDAERFNSFKLVLRNLLLDRKLWKRVYEVTYNSSSQTDGEIEKAMEILDSLGIPYQRISSTNALTKFSARKKQEKSNNYLRLIKKDSRQFLRVFPIEDYSQIISDDSTIHIDRLYVQASSKKQSDSLAEIAKKSIRGAMLE